MLFTKELQKMRSFNLLLLFLCCQKIASLTLNNRLVNLSTITDESIINLQRCFINDNFQANASFQNLLKVNINRCTFIPFFNVQTFWHHIANCSHISVTHNGLTFSRLSNDRVKVLNLSSNRIRSFPLQDLNPNVIESLSCEYCEIESMKKCSTPLYSLTTLRISYNPIDEIHLSCFPHLKEMHASAVTNVTKLNLCNLRFLENLEFNDNSHLFLQNSTLDHLSCLFSLRRLSLVNDGLTGIGNETFHFLEYLNLSKNNISFLPNNLYLQLPNVHTLVLNFNSISVIDAYSLTNIDHLDIMHNQIESIRHVSFFKHHLRLYAMSSNKIDCLCIENSIHLIGMDRCERFNDICISQKKKKCLMNWMSIFIPVFIMALLGCAFTVVVWQISKRPIRVFV